MNCPTCGHGDHRVLSTTPRGGVIERRRECIGCGFRWNTAETPVAVLERANEVMEVFRAMKRAIPDEE